MRPHLSVIIPLIFLFLLASQTYSFALERELNVATLSKINKKESEDVVRREALSQCQGHCLGKGRKLLMKSPTVSTKDKSKGEEASKPQDGAKPDVLDIAGMDYSPATRKPPIHN